MRNVRRVVFVVAYLLAMVVLLEGSARAALSLGHLSNMTRDEDRTWHRKWVTRHKSGLEIYYSFDRFDSTKGWFSRPNLHDTLTFPGKHVSTNSRGFRGTTDHAYEKDPSRTRIATIGDSYTFGDEVNDDETYPFYLQQLAPATEVINMGVHGYANDQMLILLREEGFRYSPDIVVIGFKNTDMSRNLLSFRDYAKPRFKVVDGQLRQVAGEISTPEETLARDWRRSRFLDIVSAIWYDHEVRNGARAVAAQAITGAIFTQMAADIRAHGAQPVFGLPSCYRVRRWAVHSRAAGPESMSSRPPAAGVRVHHVSSSARPPGRDAHSADDGRRSLVAARKSGHRRGGPGVSRRLGRGASGRRETVRLPWRARDWLAGRA